MPATCRNCKRPNPPDAQYCYFDGASLDGTSGRGPIAAGAQAFPTPFVFPSGRASRSFDELVLACDAEWESAKSVLKQGYLEGFFGGLGRIDLALSAKQSARAPDLDHGLAELLAKLPSTVQEPARLEIKEREINLGVVPHGSDKKLKIKIKNIGMGLLQGTILCSDTPWLGVGDAPAAPQKFFYCHQDLTVPIQVVGKALRANAKPQEGRIVVESNGGLIEIPVRVQVPITPFPDGVLAGARTPRQVAERAKASPREAAALFASGAVAAWYVANGWTYPVQGPSATGLGAVQQFFEALGLVAAPKVVISSKRVQFRGTPGSYLEQSIQVSTTEKRPVFAYGVSQANWCQVGQVALKGQTAIIPIQIPSVPSMPGEELQCRLDVAANGNQRFAVDVSLVIAKGPPQGVRLNPGAALPFSASGAGPMMQMMPPPLPGQSGPVPVQAIPVSAMPFDGRSGVTAVPAIVLGQSDMTPISPPAEEPRGKLKHLLLFLVLLLGLGGMLLHDWLLAPAKEQSRTLVKLTAKSFETLRDKDKVPAGVLEKIQGLKDRQFDSEEEYVKELARLLPKKDLANFQAALVNAATTLPFDDVPLNTDPLIALHFHNQPTLGITEDLAKRLGNVATYRFGLSMTKEHVPGKRNVPKQLTFSRYGITNNTCVMVDREDYLFGELKGTAKWVRDYEPLGRDAKEDYKIDGGRSVWEANRDIVVTQTVRIVAGAPVRDDKTGKQERRLDTCLVRYDIENRGTRPHDVGLRFLLDTFVGSSDGAPFTIPGRPGQADTLCNTQASFETPDAVPEFIEVLEYPDLKEPGTVARVQFRIGKQYDTPDRVYLGGWPELMWSELGGVAKAQGPLTRWDVPQLSMVKKELKAGNQKGIYGPDSAVTVYWDPKPLAPGKTRTVGFAYGLGKLNSQESGGKMSLSVSGRMSVDADFILTARVADPGDKEVTVTMTPAGLELVSGYNATQNVPAPAGSVSWKIHAKKAGTYTLKVTTSKGLSQTETVQIRPNGLFD